MGPMSLMGLSLSVPLPTSHTDLPDSNLGTAPLPPQSRGPSTGCIISWV